MEVQEKILEYLKIRGIKVKWFAENIGMPPSLFYQTLKSKRPIPSKYWGPIILLTKGAITMTDFMKDRIGIKDTDIEIISYDQHATSCIICLKSEDHCDIPTSQNPRAQK